jgi:hypothetical protein
MNPLLQDIVEALGSRPMVQIVILTVNGTQYALIGPVVQDPRSTELSDITAIEFGDLIPLQLAAKMLSGEYRDGLGEHLQ